MDVRLRALTGNPSGVVRSLIFASMRAVTTRAFACSSMVPSASALSLPSEVMTRTSSAAVATEIPYSDGLMKLVVIEVTGGFFYLMAAGTGAYLAVLAGETVDAGLVGARMRDMVVRIGAHLTSPPRHDGQAG